MTHSIQRVPLFGQWLKRLRTQWDLTQEALAEQMHCSVQTIRFFETGKRRPSLEMAERLAEVLAVPAAEQAEFIRQARSAIDKPVLAPDEEPLAETLPPPVIKPSVPQATTALIGREGECNVLIRLLYHDKHRLVTLVGAGGMGKTRLAMEAANSLAPHFADGVAFVPLASIQSAAQLSEAVVAALNIELKGSADPGKQVMAWLAPRHLLLILDNFEHLLESSADSAIAWSKALLAQAPKVQLLVTSRERLRVSGERIFELGGLSLPTRMVAPEASEAVMLFVERAQHGLGDFALDDHNKATIARICQLVDGMPLGIELAAAWVRVLTCDEIADEMARSLDFLVRADRDVAPRHHSMRAVFDSSWRLLSPEEQRVAARLAVLRGDFDRLAAQAIAGATLPQLAALVDKSFVRVVGQEAGSASSPQRYNVHELLRQYLFDKLQAAGEELAIKRRHAEFFTALVERIDPHFHTVHSITWRQQIALEQGNLRAALVWSIEEGHDSRVGLRLAAALGSFWEVTSGWKEGRRWLQSVLAYTCENDVVRARALVKLGELHHLLEESTLAEQRLREGLALCRSLPEVINVAYTIFQLGKIMATRDDREQAKTLLNESLILYRELGDSWGIATVLNQLGSLAIHAGDYDLASQLLDEAWPLLQTMQPRGSTGVAANLLGRALLGKGEIERAITLFQRALHIARQSEAQTGIAWSLINLALAHLQREEWLVAQGYFQDCFRVYQALESKGGMMAALEGLATIAAREGDARRAVQFLSVAAQWRKESGQSLTEHELAIQQTTRQMTEAALDPTTWQSIWFSAQHWSIPQVAQAALH